MYWKPIITIPSMTSTTPVARFRVFGCALFAKSAAILAHIRVKRMHNIQIVISGSPPIIKWETAPVRAVKVMMNTLVPTAVFSSYPSTLVKIRSIIIPPPAPMKPQIKPINTPQSKDCRALFLGDTEAMASLVVITGLRINLIPNKNVINTEKLPMVVEGTRLEI